jgi:hypothetical protein
VTKLLVLLGVLGAVFTALPKALVKLSPVFRGERPDITPAQIKAAVLFVCTQAAALGLMSASTQTYILQVTGTLLPVVLILSDVLLRSARNKAEVAKVFLPE